MGTSLLTTSGKSGGSKAFQKTKSGGTESKHVRGSHREGETAVKKRSSAGAR